MSLRTHRPSPYRVFICACGMLVLAPALPAAAGSPFGPDVAVRYQDLDLDTAAGARTVLKRIQAAASSVCAPLYHGDLGSMVKRDACRDQLTAEAIAKVNRPAVAAAYESSRRRSRPHLTTPG